jgi:urease alpha subunit
MNFVWLVVLHFTIQGHDISVYPTQAKAVYPFIKSCAVARNAEIAHWNGVYFGPKPDNIVCEKFPVR